MTTSWGGTAGWRLAARVSGSEDRLGISLGMLAARFPRFDFTTRKMRDHVSFEAVRQDKDAPGVQVVITDDMGEMRRVLAEDEDSPPGRQAPPGGG